MTMRVRSRASQRLRVVVLALLVAGVIAVPTSFESLSAQPVGPKQTAASSGDAVTIETSATAVAPDGTLGYTASVRLPQPVSYVQARLKLFRPSGRLVYQKTFVRSDVPSGTVEFSWSRDIGDVDLQPDVYPVEISLVIERDGEITRREIDTQLLVYDEDAARLPVAVVARIEAEPMSDPAGRFVIDPAVATDARRAVEELAGMVLEDARLRVSLAIAPLLLEEWRRVSEGYEAAGPSGESEVPEGSEVPQAYGSALDTLAQAARTGRLEILNVPYADPDPYGLLEAGRLADLRAHYSVGASALFRAVESTASAGSVLAGGCVPPEAAAPIEASDVDFVVVEPECTQTDEATATPGVHGLSGSTMLAVVSDPESADALGAGETTAAVAAAFAQQTGQREGSSLVVVVDVGPGSDATTGHIRAFADEIVMSPWARLTTVGSLARPTDSAAIELSEHEVATGVPDGYWDDVVESRVNARALELALSTSDPQVVTAIVNSLIAEGSYWSGPDGSWDFADRGREFAASATQVADDVLGDVSVNAVDITLSSARGSVPVAITNNGEKTLRVVVRAAADRFEVLGPTERTIELPPQETTIDIPVDLKSALSGRLVVEVTSGSLVLDRAVARVNASVLDRLAIIGLIILVLVLVLFYIIRRVRAAEATEDTALADSQ